MRLLHLRWTHLPLRLARRRLASGSFPGGPVVLGGQPWEAASVLDMSPVAYELGVRRGMSLEAAHRLVPEAAFLDPDPDADRAAVEAALDRLGSFSPGLVATVNSRDVGYGSIEVQVDGLERLWGAEPVLVERIRVALAPILPGPPKAGIAGTRFAAAVAATMAGSEGVRSVPPSGEAAFLAPLPVAFLARDPDVRGRLERFGLRRIGAVADLDRSALVARFGEDGARLHARARGEEVDPFRPRRMPERLALALPLEPPVEELVPLRFVLHRLVGALADQLLARGSATARVRLRLDLDLAFAPPGTPAGVTFEQRLPEPTAEAEAIERLLFARLERTPPRAAVTRLELELLDVAPAAGQQLALFVPQAARSARLGWQLARLALTFGGNRIGRVELADPEAPLPEARWRWLPVDVDGQAGASAGPVAPLERAGAPERLR